MILNPFSIFAAFFPKPKEEMKPIIGGTYKHYMGDACKLLAISTSETDGVEYAVYQDYKGESKVWHRPLDEFMGEAQVETEKGMQPVPRFEYLYGPRESKE